jgi:hypothetical protein
VAASGTLNLVEGLSLRQPVFYHSGWILMPDRPTISPTCAFVWPGEATGIEQLARLRSKSLTGKMKCGHADGYCQGDMWVTAAGLGLFAAVGTANVFRRRWWKKCHLKRRDTYHLRRKNAALLPIKPETWMPFVKMRMVVSDKRGWLIDL